MAELKNPHDKFFREVLGRPDVAADFLANYLPPDVAAQLELTNPDPVKDSFLDEELREHFSDLLFRVRSRQAGNDGYVYLLFEHKSTPEEGTPLQLLRYFVRIRERMPGAGAGMLPPIFPIVLYHGRQPWRVPLRFSAQVDFRGVDTLRPYVPEFSYQLADLSQFEEQEIRGAVWLRVFLLLLKYVFSDELPPRLPEILALLRDVENQSALQYLRTALIYVSAAARHLSKDDVRQALHTAFPEKEEGVMADFVQEWIQEGLQKGMQQGLQQGLQQGKTEGLTTVVFHVLERRFGPLSVTQQELIRSLPLETLEQLSSSLLDFSSTTELDQWLETHLPRQ